MDSYSAPDHSTQSDLAVQSGNSRPRMTGWQEIFFRPRSIGRLSIVESILVRFSPAERLLLYILMVILAASTFAMASSIDKSISITIPARGGTLVEGEVGPARFINPILTLSQPDQDLTALVYSGLMRELPDGTIVPDLASGYTVSTDGTTYTFTLRPNAKFQDGTSVSAADVLYTIGQAQDPNLKSPQQANWAGVTASSPDPETVVFTLAHAYAPFLEDTTLGILPKHLWQNVSDEEFPFDSLNTHPVGSGPYKVVSVQTDSTGSATRYDLVPFSGYILGNPYLTKLTFLFYPDAASMEKAFDQGQIAAMAGVSPGDLSTLTRKDASVVVSPLPRVYGVFFNQGHNPVLADASVRAALNDAIDKQSVVNTALDGYGVTLDGPIPPGASGTVAHDTSVPLSSALHAPAQASAATITSVSTSSDSTDSTSSPQASTTNDSADNASADSTDESSYAAAARTDLENGGWIFNTTASLWEKGNEQLTFTLSTADEPELVATANAVAASWSAAGIKATVQIYPLSELNTSVIAPRNYDAVLFGEVVGPSLDLYAFWDSSQRNDPGLNLAMYANETTDTLLSQARATTDVTARDALYTQFAADIEKDQPAVFLYAPDFLYIVPESIKGISLGALATPADRFESIYGWYTQTQSVWKIFAGNAHS
jgi:peptide/nickel transport system substrate-binding protein